MNQIQLSIPSKEFVEEYFNKVLNELNSLKSQLKTSNGNSVKYYRNKDLRKIFGLSVSSIERYRDQSILPFTKIGLIYYYPVHEINRILENNANYGKDSLCSSNFKLNA